MGTTHLTFMEHDNESFMLLVDMGDILNDNKFGLPGQAIWGLTNQYIMDQRRHTQKKINGMNMPQMKKVVI